MLPELKEEPLNVQRCGMEYDRDLNASINIAHRVMSSMGWRSSETRKPADEGIGEKPTLNAGSPFQ